MTRHGDDKAPEQAQLEVCDKRFGNADVLQGAAFGKTVLQRSCQEDEKPLLEGIGDAKAYGQGDKRGNQPPSQFLQVGRQRHLLVCHLLINRVFLR
jgi:hypothetical protein